MKKTISVFLFLVMIMAGTITPLAETPTISLSGPELTITYYRTGREMKEGRSEWLKYDLDGILILNGALYPGGKDPSMAAPNNGTNKTCRFIMDGKTYDLQLISAKSYSRTDVKDDEILARTFTYRLLNPRTAVQADLNAYKVTTFTRELFDDTVTNEYIDNYLIDGVKTSEDEYLDYRMTHGYRETTSNEYRKELSRVFTGGSTVLEKITYTENGKTVTLKEKDAIPGYGTVMYQYATTDCYDVVDLYERTHSLVTVDSPKPAPQTQPDQPAAEPEKPAPQQQETEPESPSSESGKPASDPAVHEEGPSTEQPAEAQPYVTTENITTTLKSSIKAEYKDRYVVNGKDASEKEYSAAKSSSKAWSEKVSTELLSASDPVLDSETTVLKDAVFISPDGTERKVRTDESGKPLEELTGPGTLRLNFVKTLNYVTTQKYEKLHSLTVKEQSVQPAAPAAQLFRPTLKKPSAGKKSFTVRWKKPSKSKLKKISGYQIQISENKDFSNAKQFTAGRKLTSKKIKKLKKKTSYYIYIYIFRQP